MRDFYRKTEDIWLSTQIYKDVDELYRKRSEADKSLVATDKVYELDINNIVELPDGRLRIMMNGARFECMFKRGKNDKLWVFSSAARTRANGRANIPLFERWSYYSVLEDSILCVSDPMYYDYPELNCGWFWGNDEHNYREYLAQIVTKIVEYLAIKKDNVIFMGVSAGGTTSIHTAALFGHGTAISINGQLNFETEKRTQRLKDFKDSTDIDPTQTDKYNRNKLYEVVKEAGNVKFIIATNSCSYADTTDQLMYFCEKSGHRPKLGLTVADNVVYWLYDVHCKNAHNAFDDKNIIFALEYLTNINKENVEEYNQLFMLFSSFWNAKYMNSEKVVPVESSFEIAANIEKDFKFDLSKDIKNIVVEGVDNKYNRYSLKEFESGKVYIIKINAMVEDKDGAGIYTLGLFDSARKNFIFKYGFSNNKEHVVAFYCNNPDLELCVYSGLYSQAENKKLIINSIGVFEMKFSNMNILNQYKPCKINQTARLDCVFAGTDANSQVAVENMSECYCDISSPAWINKNGKGFVLSSDRGYAKLKLSNSGEGHLSLIFRAADVSVDNRRLPIWVDYNSIKINGSEQLEDITPSCHDKPISLKIELETSTELEIEFRWTAHFEELNSNDN